MQKGILLSVVLVLSAGSIAKAQSEMQQLPVPAIAPDYRGPQKPLPELNRVGAQLVRDAAVAAQKRDGRPRFVAGAIGPTNRTASISPDVNNPGFRAVTFDDLRSAYG